MASSGREGRSIKLETRIQLTLFLEALLAAGVVTLTHDLGLKTQLMALAVTLLPCLWLLSRQATAPLRHGLAVLDSGLRGYRDGDYSLRLPPAQQPELANLFDFFNNMADLAREEHSAIYQKEFLLDTLVQCSPMAILLVGPNGRLVLANQEARHMLRTARPLADMKLDDFLAAAPEELRQVLEGPADALFTIPGPLEEETFHFSQRRFPINTQPHRLIMIRHLTREMRRQEIRGWKKLIRLINHELNNTLAPIRSLLHSARTIYKDPEQHHKLERIFVAMDQSSSRLQLFLEQYASFARLPSPRCEWVNWHRFLEELTTLVPCSTENRLDQEWGFFDSAQLQQALLNLLKNAAESESEPSEIKLCLEPTLEGGTLIQVRDRGRGIKAESLEKVFLPFYSTKQKGTGLGLALCREIIESHGGTLRLDLREGGGLCVSCRLPAPDRQDFPGKGFSAEA